MPRGASRQYLPGTGGTHPTSTIRPLVHGAHSLHAGSRILTRCRRYQRGELRCALETPAFKISLPWFGRLQVARPSQLSSGRLALASFPRDRGAGFLLIFPAEGNYLEPLKPPGVHFRFVIPGGNRGPITDLIGKSCWQLAGCLCFPLIDGRNRTGRHWHCPACTGCQPLDLVGVHPSRQYQI